MVVGVVVFSAAFGNFLLLLFYPMPVGMEEESTWSFGSQVVPQAAFLPLVDADELTEDGLFFGEVERACLPVWEQHVLFLLEGNGLPEAAERAAGQSCPGHMG